MSKEEKKKRENEQIKILNDIKNRQSHFGALSPFEKAKEYSYLLKELENNLKSFPEEDKNKKYYKEYEEEIEKINEIIAQIYFEDKKYDKAIEIDKKIIKKNAKYHKSFKRLYLSYWALGDKELAVIYGSFLLSRTDKNIKNKYYKDLVPEIEKNLRQVAKEFKNKSWWSEIKLNRGMYIRAILFVICIIYLILNFKDFKLLI